MTPLRPKTSEPEVRAAGGVVWRAVTAADESGATWPGFETVLIHRPRYDDWSFPKGKLGADESYESAALREVAEETGLVCELGDELPPSRYLDGKGRDKQVRYWTMWVVGTVPWTANDEVDERRWVMVDDARDLLTYERDREVLDVFAASIAGPDRT